MLRRGRTEYVPVSHIMRDPVSAEAVSIRWFYIGINVDCISTRY